MKLKKSNVNIRERALKFGDWILNGGWRLGFDVSATKNLQTPIINRRAR